MKYHHLLQEHYDNWAELEQKIEELPSALEKGEVFEQFVLAYLTLNKDYYQIQDVYRASDIPTELRSNLKLQPTTTV